RDQIAAQPGVEYEVNTDGKVITLVPVRTFHARFPATTVKDLIGCLPYSGPSVTDADMREGIARAVRESYLKSIS
ncbi:MAG: hypothetical protein ACKVON_09005, partial [Beijerinckiaceae bacterium]